MKYYAVLDTNVLVSAMLKSTSVPGQVMLEALLGNIIPLLHEDIVTEYREVLSRPKFRFNPSAVEAVIEGIISRGIFLDAEPVEEFMPDPKDVIFYEIVMEGRQTMDNAWLVTGNLKHFPVKSYVVTPKEMLEILAQNNGF